MADIPTSMYISHGEDDVAGGLATVDKVHESTFLKSDHYNYYMVSIKEVPGHRFNWNYLMENQKN